MVMFSQRTHHALHSLAKSISNDLCRLRTREASSSSIRHASSSNSSSRNISSSNGTNESKTKKRPQVCWLDLNGSGLSAIERLCLEEALLRHDPFHRSWAIVGAHDPIYNTRLKKIGHYLSDHNTQNDNSNNHHADNDNSTMIHDQCIIIMGIGGKPENLLNIPKVKKDGVVVVKRFSGGGTVVIDHSSLWTTFIGRTNDFPHVQPYPKDIMRWSADEIFQHTFEGMGKRSGLYGDNSNKNMIENGDNFNNVNGIKKKTLIMDTKSCGLASINQKQREFFIETTGTRTGTGISIQNNSSLLFELRENDYVLGQHKMGGNAQSIISGGWLHHTSFLWDYVKDNMEYLTLPQKRPDYRGDRSHDDFLIKLKSVYGDINGDREGKRMFFSSLKRASENAFDLQEVTLNEALHVVNELGGWGPWFEGKCRTKLVKLN